MGTDEDTLCDFWKRVSLCGVFRGGGACMGRVLVRLHEEIRPGGTPMNRLLMTRGSSRYLETKLVSEEQAFI